MGRHIGISLLAFSPERLAGQGTYTLGLTRALVTRQRHHYTLFVPERHLAFWQGMVERSDNMVVCRIDPDDRTLRVLFEQVLLPALARRSGVEKVFFPHVLAPRWRLPEPVVTVYDLLLFSAGTDFPWYKKAYHRWTYKRLVRAVNQIVTISQFCREDIARKLGVSRDRIAVVSPGVDAEFLPPTQSTGTPTWDLAEPYLLSVAGTYPHKRLDILIEAFSLVAKHRPELHLALAGTFAGGPRGASAVHLRAQEIGLASRIHILPRLRREELPRLFARATALVSASEFEGFGIPVAEAMALGCPVAAAPAEAVKEVLGGYGWLAADFSAQRLAEAIMEALAARAARSGVLRKAQLRARTFYTWDTAAAELERVLDS